MMNGSRRRCRPAARRAPRSPSPCRRSRARRRGRARARRLDRVGVHLELVESVLERVLRRHGVPGQLAGLARRHEAAAELARERSTGDVAARLGAEYEVGLARRGPLRQPLDGLRERLASPSSGMMSLKITPGFGKSGTSRIFASRSIAMPSSLPGCDPAHGLPEEQLRELLRRLAERAQLLEPLAGAARGCVSAAPEQPPGRAGPAARSAVVRNVRRCRAVMPDAASRPHASAVSTSTSV